MKKSEAIRRLNSMPVIKLVSILDFHKEWGLVVSNGRITDIKNYTDKKMSFFNRLLRFIKG